MIASKPAKVVYSFFEKKKSKFDKRTTVSQKTLEDVIPKLTSFVMHLRKLQIAHKFVYTNIYAMDETVCWLDMPSDMTIDFCGTKSVPLKTTGHEKDHFTVTLTAWADGTKCKPYIVFKSTGTRLIKELEKIAVVIVQLSVIGWMNDKLTIDYLHSIIGHLSFHERLLVWDVYRCHTSDSTRAELKKMRLHTAIIPGGCTKFIQAPGVVWNSPFKSHIRGLYNAWLFDTSQHEFTKAGNMKAPSHSLLCKWVKAAWSSIPIEMIKKSFCTCAITTNPDGNEDEGIHCFKAGQPCEAGRSVVMELMAQLEAENLNNSDPFTSDVDEEEDEACIDTDDGSNDSDSSDSDLLLLLASYMYYCLIHKTLLLFMLWLCLYNNSVLWLLKFGY